MSSHLPTKLPLELDLMHSKPGQQVKPTEVQVKQHDSPTFLQPTQTPATELLQTRFGQQSTVLLQVTLPLLQQSTESFF
jgi:hypothetical protein